MNFEKEINEYEDNISKYSYMVKEGNIPIAFTAVHTVVQNKETGIKWNETYTGAICQYIGEQLGTYYFIKAIDNGVDSNSIELDEFKQTLLKEIKNNNIKMLIDIHGSKEEREFDIELGTLNNETVDQTIEDTFVDSFINNGILNIELNKPFKGGGITRYIYENTNIDIIQLEINGKYRDKNNTEDIKKICDALIDFVKKYTNFL